VKTLKGDSLLRGNFSSASQQLSSAKAANSFVGLHIVSDLKLFSTECREEKRKQGRRKEEPESGEPSLLEVSVRSLLTVSESFGLNFPGFFIGPARRDVQIRRHCSIYSYEGQSAGTWITG
jgi:hypothetical protein